MDNEIKDIQLKFNCPADWNGMKTVEGGKFCDHCQKKVYDFTDAKQEIFLKILAEDSNNVCGRFRLEQMMSVNVKFPVWKRWLSAAMVLIGINIFSNKTEAQTKNTTNTKSISKTKAEPEMVVGAPLSTQLPDEMPHFPGGDQKLVSFLHKNLHAKSVTIPGRIFVSFTISTDGSLSNFKIIRGANKDYNDEVLKVLKLSPKWIPAKKSGKPIVYHNYTIPVTLDINE